jgi:hypothetical protein
MLYLRPFASSNPAVAKTSVCVLLQLPFNYNYILPNMEVMPREISLYVVEYGLRNL